MRKMLLALCSFIVVAVATPASAAIYTYQTNFNFFWNPVIPGVGATTITIDTVAETATFTGPNIAVVMEDTDFATFDPATDTTTWFAVDDAYGTFDFNGQTYDLLFSTSPKHTGFQLDGSVGSFIWMYGDVDGDDVWDLDYDGKGHGSIYTGSTGSPVPEPGALALMGLGLAAVTFGRRRRKVAA